MAGFDDGGQALEELVGLVLFLLVVRDGVGLAAGEEFGDDSSQHGQVAAAGAQEAEVFLYGPAGEDAGAGEVEAQGVDPVAVGGVEEEVADQLVRGVLGQSPGEGVLGALEVEQQAVDHEVGVGGDVDAREGGPAGAVLGPGAGAQRLQGAGGGQVELVDDVVDHVLVGELQEPVEGEAAGVL